MTVQERYGNNIHLDGSHGLEFHDNYTTATYRMTNSGIITLGGNLAGISYQEFLHMTVVCEIPFWGGIMVYVD